MTVAVHRPKNSPVTVEKRLLCHTHQGREQRKAETFEHCRLNSKACESILVLGINTTQRLRTGN